MGGHSPFERLCFHFIQKQVSEAIESAKRTGRLVVKSPHRQIDLWMDAVLCPCSGTGGACAGSVHANGAGPVRR